MKKHFSILLFIAFVATLSGCGDGALKTYPVTGTVTYQGQPLAGATINFFPKVAGQGDAGTGQTDSRGFYQLQTMQGRVNAGTTPGEYYVMISKIEIVGAGTFIYYDDGTRVEDQRSVSLIPERYSTPEGGLTATVTQGRNEFNFDL